jgi:signal transduction histidine kinase
MKLITLIIGNKLVVPLSCLAAVAMLAANELTYRYTTRYTRESIATAQTQIILNDLSIRMLNAETGQRGFLLTGRLEYLQPYEQATTPVTQSFLKLKQRYQSQEASLALLMELEALSSSKLHEMAQTVELKKNNLSESSLTQVLEGSGKQSMQRMREITATLLSQESELLAISRKKLQATQIVSRASIALLSVFCLIAILFYLRKNLQLKSEQLQLRRELANERDQLGVTVRKRTLELTQLARYLQTNREEERSRLARNLHDDLGALLTSAKLDAARIKSRVDQSSPQVLELLTHLVGNLDGSILLGRKIIEDLRPSALNHLGLVATLEIFAREFTDSSALAVHSSFEEVDLPPDSQLMVYRLMQEACTNIMKYAKATNVWLKLGTDGNAIVASVRDDGVGFDTHRQLTTSYGLLGMRYRVEAAQGVLNIVSEPGQGTLVQATL